MGKKKKLIEKVRVDLGEYIVLMEYEKLTGSLDVTVLDEAEEVIETLNISNDE